MSLPRAKPRKIASSTSATPGREVFYRELAERDLEKKGYLARELVQCGMPLSKPPEEKVSLQRKNGNITVTYASGIDPKSGTHIGLPYGPIARLLLVWINTEANTQRSRRIHVTSNLTQFMRDVGLQYRSGEKGTTRTLREQIRRLFLAQISFYREESQEEGTREQFELMTITQRYELWWSYKSPDENSFFDSWIELGESFYEAIIKNPVPIKLEHLKSLRKSPLAIDFYVWASYRLYTLNQSKTRSLFLPLAVLQHQLGSSFDRKRDFAKAMNEAINKVRNIFPHLDCELDREGLTLRSGPLPLGDPDQLIAVSHSPNRAARTKHILQTRTFDDETLLRGKAIAPGWDMKELARAYFEWIEKMPEPPKNIRAHFISFCRTHAKKNR